MPLKNGHFTRIERGFIDAYARTGDVVYAAWKAGVKGPMVNGRQILARPAVREEATRRAKDILFGELLPLALATHKSLLTDKAVPAGARLGAAKLVYDQTISAAESSETDDKEPSEMTAGELQRSIARLASELEGRPLRAKDVTPQPLEVEADDSPAGGVFD